MGDRNNNLTNNYEQFEILLNSMDALVYVADMETYEVLFINNYGKKLLGDITGKICWQSIQEGQNDPCDFCTNKHLIDSEGKTGNVYHWEFQNTITGKWFDIRDRAIEWVDGRIVRLEIAHDITQRKQIEDELLLQSEIISNMAEGVFLLCHDDLKIVYANPMIEKMFGYNSGEMIGKHISELNVPTNKESYEKATEILKTLLETGKWHGELKNIKKDGTHFWSYANVSIFEHSKYGKVFVNVHSDITDRKQAIEESIVMKERSRLARELHDSVTQSLYSLTLFAETGRQLMHNAEYERLDKCLKELSQNAQATLKEMRLLIYDLRPAIFEQDGIFKALQQRLDSVEQRAGIKAKLIVEGNGELSNQEEEGLYRIVQEALNNSLKHSGANSVTVKINLDVSCVKVMISDNGVGFDLKKNNSKHGMGLNNIIERVQKLGGKMEIQTAPGNGTSIFVSIKRETSSADEKVLARESMQ